MEEYQKTFVVLELVVNNKAEEVMLFNFLTNYPTILEMREGGCVQK